MKPQSKGIVVLFANYVLSRRGLILMGAALGGTLPISPLPAFELPDTFQFHGFASQGFTYSSENRFFGDSNDGSFAFTELGANVSWRAASSLQLSAQVLSRRAGGGDEGDIRLDFGFVDYTFLSDENNRWGIRLGRVKNPFGLYNETRDVVFTRPGVLLPQSIYPDQLRGLQLSSDGLYVYGERRTPAGDFFFHAGLGYARANDENLEASVFGAKVPGQFDSELSYLTRIMYEWNGGRVRAALSFLRANLDFESEGEEESLRESARFEPWIASLQYNAERWSLTGEYSRAEVRNPILDFGGAIKFTSESFYVQGSYRLNLQWEGILRYDVFYADRNDRDGERFAAADLLGRPAHSRFAKDWTVGVNWNPRSNFTLRAEFHYIDGTGWLPVLDNPVPNETGQYWNLFTLMAGYRF